MQNPRRKLDDKCLCLPCVFSSVVACAIKSVHVLQELSYSGDIFSLLTNNSSSDSKAFLRFIAFSGSPTPVHHAFHRMAMDTVTNLLLQVHHIHCGYTFLRCIDLLHSDSVATVLHCGHFELSSYRENGFLVLLHFLRCTCLYLLLDT